MEGVRERLLQRIGGMDDIIDLILERFQPDSEQKPFLFEVYSLRCRFHISPSFVVTGGIGGGKSYIVSEIVKAIQIPHLFIKCASIIQANIGESEEYLHVRSSWRFLCSKCFNLPKSILAVPLSSMTSSFWFQRFQTLPQWSKHVSRRISSKRCVATF